MNNSWVQFSLGVLLTAFILMAWHIHQVQPPINLPQKLQAKQQDTLNNASELMLSSQELSFSDIPLPLPPIDTSKSQQSADQLDAANTVKVDLIKNAKTPVITKDSGVNVAEISQAPNKVESVNVSELHKKRQNITSGTPKEVAKTQISRQDIQSVFQQLQAENGLDMQIAWPQQRNERQTVINYLYRCAGVQFAVLENQQLTYLSPKRYVNVSHWMRLAQGALSDQEARWYQGSKGVPVRVFPQSVDWALATLIAEHLQGEKLQVLRATYDVVGRNLRLIDVSVNQASISHSWPLYQGKC
ncbi:hypothetical protein [uncultured Paraglaciecola sp.]|uniref:hypothetical protein n=1 Tax=uncultured Paraglaciecola sp. TaxID=1765024 RepID=UPI00262BC9EC|nr:hypothetical protein [uncultured Paraglaciecola sp.]